MRFRLDLHIASYYEGPEIIFKQNELHTTIIKNRCNSTAISLVLPKCAGNQKLVPLELKQ